MSGVSEVLLWVWTLEGEHPKASSLFAHCAYVALWATVVRAVGLDPGSALWATIFSRSIVDLLNPTASNSQLLENEGTETYMSTRTSSSCCCCS